MNDRLGSHKKFRWPATSPVERKRVVEQEENGDDEGDNEEDDKDEQSSDEEIDSHCIQAADLFNEVSVPSAASDIFALSLISFLEGGHWERWESWQW